MGSRTRTRLPLPPRAFRRGGPRQPSVEATVGAGQRVRRALTTRSVVLAAVVLVAVLSLLYPVRQYFAIRGDISAEEVRHAETTSAVADLERRLAALSDPATIADAARRQLFLVPEGSRTYVLLEPTAEERAAAEQRARSERTGEGPWWERVQRSWTWAGEQQ